MNPNPLVRQLLFISYYFPPSGGPGVQRTVKFVKYLPKFGWQPTVLTVDPQHAAFPNLDDSLQADVPASLEVIRTRSWDPYGGYARLLGKRKSETVSVSFGRESKPGALERLGKWFRANVFLPDARVGWVPYAVRSARALLARRNFDAILTTGPPHSSHLIGLRLGAAGDGRPPWVADFRDPWTKIDYRHELPMTGMAVAIDRKLERRVLTSADRITTISPTMAQSFRQETDRQIELVMNGFDPEDFIDDAAATSNEFVIRHVGNMPAARNPESLWKALSSIDPEDRRSVRVELVGSVDIGVLESADRYGVGSHVRVVGYVSHHEAIGLMKTADTLLLVVNDVKGREGIMTGKLFEYIGSGRPVLGIGPTNGDAAAVIRQAEAGKMFAYDDADGVRHQVQAHLEAKAHQRPIQGAGWERAQMFSRITQTKQLADILNDIITAAAPDRSEPAK